MPEQPPLRATADPAGSAATCDTARPEYEPCPWATKHNGDTVPCGLSLGHEDDHLGAWRDEAVIFPPATHRCCWCMGTVGATVCHNPGHPVVTPAQAAREPASRVLRSSAPSRADKIAAAIVPDQLDQYLPASETNGGKSSVEVFDKRTGDC